MIILCALVPALILVALYPKMEEAMLKYQEQIEKEVEHEMEDASLKKYYMEDNFINYAVEASYYIYGQMRQEQLGTPLDFSVLREYGWINDYYYVNDSALYYAELASVTEGEAAMVKKNSDIDLLSLSKNAPKKLPPELEEKGIKGYVKLTYDMYGQLADLNYAFADDVESYQNNMFRRANESVEKYLNNANFYVSEHYDETAYEDMIPQYEISGERPHEVENSRLQDFLQICPRNFSIVFAVPEGGFLYEQNYAYYGYSAETIYTEIGAWWIVLGLAMAVMLIALLLPFFKKLQTGWEPIFCMPFEIICCIILCGFAATIGMYQLMCHTTMTELQVIAVERTINFLGTDLDAKTLYTMLMVLNFLGWAALFFAEYVVVVSLRQFLCGPKAYLKNRLLIVRAWKWFKNRIVKYGRIIYDYVTDIDINDKLNSSVFKIVAVNFGVLTLFCCMWFFGIAGLLVYSIVLFVIMRKYGEKIRQQFRSILEATNQMAEGNLKITLEEDLGIFAPIGKGLEEVQQGFAKAVAEEAKSQNMKTELITNVSHDLKTPLTAIITYVDLLKKEDITETERDSYIATIDQKSQRLKVLIEDLFEVSKANSGNIQMHFMDVDVVNLMKQVRLELEEKIADSNLSFRWNLPEKHVILSLDGQRTYRIFENLLNNILKYSMDHTRVYIDILELGEEVHIVFRNISAVELAGDGQNLTERFVRGDASRNTEGSGLGLAIVKSFVELQNGRLKIDVDGDLFKVSIIWKR